jgi:hypothetical protein
MGLHANVNGAGQDWPVGPTSSLWTTALHETSTNHVGRIAYLVDLGALDAEGPNQDVADLVLVLDGRRVFEDAEQLRLEQLLDARDLQTIIKHHAIRRLSLKMASLAPKPLAEREGGGGDNAES